jgi:hypothetical protein
LEADRAAEASCGWILRTDQDPTHALEEKLATLERVAAHVASEVEWSLVDDYYSSQAV